MTRASEFSAAAAMRPRALADFLHRAGRRPEAARPLAGDASHRRYLRLPPEAAAPAAVVMDAPPESGEDVRSFIAVTHWLRGHGFSAPRILAADPTRGFLLLEDLGDALFSRLLATGAAVEGQLYAAAVDVLAALASLPVPAEIGPAACRLPLRSYDAAVLGGEATLLIEWWLPAVTGAPVSGDLAAEYTALVAAATASVAGAREVVVLRDYHADNLIWLPARTGLARVGLLDYQDALAGHPAYDLVSLLEDARRDTAPELRAAMLERYLAARPGMDAEAFTAAYAALGAQRNLKIIGIFARLALRDRKPRYLAMIPRVWGNLTNDLAHPGLAPLARWVARHVPAPEPAVLARVEAAARAGIGRAGLHR